MIKILFLISGLSAGGAEKVLRNLVNNFDQSKFDITVQTIDEDNADKYLVKGIHYKAINRCKSRIGKKIFNIWFRITAELGLTYPLYIKDDYDIEVAYLECGATKVLASSTNKKAVKLAWVHCDLSKRESTARSIAKTLKYYRTYDKTVCVSEDVKAGFHKLYGDDISSVVLHNVIDEEEIINKASESIVWDTNSEEVQLLAVGRLTQQKNFAHLIETCYRLYKDGYKIKLYILGEGPERESLEKLISDRYLKNVVELLGFKDNPYPYIKAADFVVCSSRYEGISTVVTEALVLGKPIITTPCTGMQELLGNSEYGMIAKDTPDGLYNCFKEIFESPELEKHYAQEAKKRGRDFYKGNVIKETSDFFFSELSKKEG
ncbi:MAG: glycosyltransferase [Ruminococcus sp.]|nr:glycosyltransferase [Ruminococcus sp.]